MLEPTGRQACVTRGVELRSEYVWALLANLASIFAQDRKKATLV
jgi:hypothetical protein